MTTLAFLSALRRQNVSIWIDGDKLRYSGPPGALSPVLKNELIRRKAEILKLLKASANSSNISASPVRSHRLVDGMPLSFSQQRLWFLNQLEPGNPFYNILGVTRLGFKVDAEVLEISINELIRRQHSLRTKFSATRGIPAQIIVSELQLTLPVIDLSDMVAAEREIEAHRLATEEAQRPFDLSCAPLVRMMLVRLFAEDHVLIVTMHHIISDAWSTGIFWSELGELYAAAGERRTPRLSDLEIQYADFAVWQREWLSNEVIERQLLYWRKQLAGLPQLQLTTDFRRPATQSFRGARYPVVLSSELTRGVRAFSERTGATPFMVLLAAFKVLLSRYARQQDIVIGTPIAGRRWGNVEPLIGFFVNSLVLRTDISGNPSFRELVGRIREVALGAYANQDMPFEMLVEKLKPDRDPGRNPLFQVTFQLMQVTRDRKTKATAPALPDISRGTAIFDIAFSLADEARAFTGNFEYNIDLFEEATIARMIDQYTVILRAGVADPEAKISQLPAMETAQRHRLLFDWNKSKASTRSGECLHHLFEEQVARTPDAIALVSETEELTFQELNLRADHYARKLRAAGIGPEKIAALYLERSPQLVCCMLAVAKAGGAYLPLDPSYPPRRTAFMLEDSCAAVVVTSEQLAASLPASRPCTILVEAIDAVEVQLTEFVSEPDNPKPTHPAYVLYTSGSTGKPKAVVIEHRAICNHMRWMQRAFLFDASDHILQRTPVGFDASVWEVHAPLGSGARLILAPVTEHFDPTELGEVLQAQGITVLQLVPSMLRQLLDAHAFDQCTSLRWLFCGGESLTGDLARRFANACPAQLVNLYGPTEATIDATYHVVRRGDDARAHIPIGRPIDNMLMYIVDEHDEIVPMGIPGELLIGGEGLARGYLGQPTLTEERFIPDPFNCHEGKVYRTGDVCRYLPHGNIEFLGRADYQVKIRGVRIELEGIEAVLREHPLLRDIAVIAREDQLGDQRLVAYVVPDQRQWELNNSGACAEQVNDWQRIYDEIIYREPRWNEAPTFDISGWNSTDTGEPIPPGDMREWLEHTVARIRRLKPRRVLEIGCGTGLLLFQIAPQCERYVATDFSTLVIEVLRSRVERIHPDLLVEVLLQTADDFTGFGSESFDLVILNSVVQYFPSIEYLVNVLEKAAGVITPDGSVFIGDVRSLPLLEAFHTAIEVARVPASMPISQFRQLCSNAILEERELVIAPEFFGAVTRHCLGGGEILVEPKRGKYRNEIASFRYDVTLRKVAVPLTPVLPAVRSFDTSADIRRILVEERPEILHLRGIPNLRTRYAAQLVEFVVHNDEAKSVEDLRRFAASLTDEGADPDELWDMADELFYDVEVTWTQGAADGACDALYVRRDQQSRPSLGTHLLKLSCQPWFTYANVPLRGLMIHKLLPELRSYLELQMPQNAMPSSFIFLTELPKLSNGKLDRQSLPPPEYARATDGCHIEPRGEFEEKIAAVWKQVLHVNRVGALDDFFHLGGHSLLATQVIARLREFLDFKVPLRTIFDSPKLADFAAALALLQNGARPKGPAIRRLGRPQLSAAGVVNDG